MKDLSFHKCGRQNPGDRDRRSRILQTGGRMAKAALTTTANYLALAPSGADVAENKLGRAAAWRSDAFGGVAALSPSNKSFLTPDGVAR
jgi:hypothetical protein